MSKQRGKGDRKKYWHKGGRKRHGNDKQCNTKFDDERFLRDMESALERMTFRYYMKVQLI